MPLFLLCHWLKTSMDGVGGERKEVSFGLWLVGCYCVLLELLNHTTSFPSFACSVIRKIKKKSQGFLQPHKTFDPIHLTTLLLSKSF